MMFKPSLVLQWIRTTQSLIPTADKLFFRNPFQPIPAVGPCNPVPSCAGLRCRCQSVQLHKTAWCGYFLDPTISMQDETFVGMLCRSPPLPSGFAFA